jgi:hypothetical protein
VSDASPTDALAADLAATVEATRRAERDIFGGIDPAVRARPIRPGDWTSQDHQAHLTAWKARQAERFDAAREGREIPATTQGEETDAINAELQAQRAGWAWDDLVREADETAERLAEAIRATDAQVIRDSNRLIGGTFGNGVLHALVHFRWLHEAVPGVDLDRIQAFAVEAEALVRAESLPDADRAIGLYDLACHHALTGRLDSARALLSESLRMTPDLIDYCRTDTDLTEFWGELDDLATATPMESPSRTGSS